MSYAALDSPLPGLTVSPTGDRCCGMRGMLGYQPGAHALLGMLGQDETPIFDTTSTDLPIDTSPVDTGILTDLPLPNQITPIDVSYPSTVGTEYVSNGDGTYTNIQTGQSVPYATAQQVTAATAPVAVDTTPTGQGSNVTIVDPTTGSHSSVSTNNLTAAAQALQAAGQLVNAAGQLTTQGRTLLAGGNLYKAPPASGISGAMSSLTSWMGANQNLVLIGGLVLVVGVLFVAPMRKGRR